jgi:beta-hydroxylase
MFYNIDDIEPKLNSIKYIDELVKLETTNVINTEWTDWPEKSLYANRGEWKIFPFYAFNVWVLDNCDKCPTITKFLKSIPGLKIALLSKLSAGMKLTPHKGWGNHSNGVLRCHYGIRIPDSPLLSTRIPDSTLLSTRIPDSTMGCYISVKDDIEIKKFHLEGEWICFDDSKEHYAENPTNEDRIVLILDIERPSHIKRGISDVGDSRELIEIVKI